MSAVQGMQDTRDVVAFLPQCVRNFELLATAPGGVARLRELLLGIALTGRLRNQGRILQSEGSESPAGSPNLLRTFPLPKEWKWQSVEQLCTLRTGATPSTGRREYYGGPIKWLVSGDIHKQEIHDCAGRITELAMANANCKMLPPDSVLIALNGQGKTHGTVALLRIAATCNQSLVAMTPNPEAKITAEFLFWNLRYRYREIRDITGQKQRRGLNMRLVGQLPIAVAPLQEQLETVSQINELMRLCDVLEAKGQLEAEEHSRLLSTLLGTLTETRSPEELASNWQRVAAHFDLMFDRPDAVDALEQTILGLAVRGLLGTQRSDDEPACAVAPAVGPRQRRSSSGRSPRGASALDEVAEEEHWFELPLGWAWTRLGLLGDWGSGATPPRSKSEYFGGSVSWFKSGELSADYISKSEETLTELALRDCSLRRNRPGDVLLAMYGATIGKTAILSVEGTTNQAVCACTPFATLQNTYLLLLLKALKSHFVSMGAGGAQPNISREKIINTVVGLPPLTEQTRIVARVARLRRLCADLRERLAASQATQARLADALVESATAT